MSGPKIIAPIPCGACGTDIDWIYADGGRRWGGKQRVEKRDGEYWAGYVCEPCFDAGRIPATDVLLVRPREMSETGLKAAVK
jgi:hypothetical protein